METARRYGLTFQEKMFTVAEAKQAREAFQTSASGLVMPVISVDGIMIGNGKPGPVAMELRRLYHCVAEISRRDRLLT
jgi:D-alanine transaminase